MIREVAGFTLVKADENESMLLFRTEQGPIQLIIKDILLDKLSEVIKKQGTEREG